MSLSAKMKCMGTFFIISLLSFNACEQSGGFGLGEENITPVEFVLEEVEVTSSVVLLDSVVSSDVGRGLFGEVVDAGFGKSVFTAYTGLSANTALQPDIPEDAVFDSLKIRFQLGYIYDTTDNNRDLEISFVSIDEPFPDLNYENTDSFANGNRVIGSGKVKVNTLDSIYGIDGDDNWGREIFELLKDKDEKVTDQSNFRNFFPGFAIKAKEGTQNVFGFNPGQNFQVSFFYNESNEDNTGRIARGFTMNGSSVPASYSYEADRSGSIMSLLNETSTEFDAPLNGIQAGTGIVTKLDISGLESFVESKDKIIINLAELTVGPIEDLADGTEPPNFLFLFITDQTNTLIPSNQGFRAIQQDGANPIGKDFPLQLFYNPDTRTYSASITTYAQAYNRGDFRRNELFLYPSSMNVSFANFLVNPENIGFKIFFSEIR